MEKISENLEKIFELDRRRIATMDKEVSAHIKATKHLKSDRKKLVNELDLLGPLRKVDLVEFKAKREEYCQKADLKVAENKKLDEDIKTGKIDWAEHAEKRRKPEDIRTEWRKKFWAEYEMTLTPIRERHAKILELEAQISLIDSKIVYKQNAIYGLAVVTTEKKLADLRRYVPGGFRVAGVVEVASERTLFDQLAKGKSLEYLKLEITSNEDLLNLPLDARFIFENLDLVYDVIEKFRDFDFSDGDKIMVTYMPATVMDNPPFIESQVIYSPNSKQKDPKKDIITTGRK